MSLGAIVELTVWDAIIMIVSENAGTGLISGCWSRNSQCSFNVLWVFGPSVLIVV